ncbi:hypothetical protein AN403_6019 [Pseudomonas fluorescens]|uniref:Uncharacterized protein n=1 Tax=Pseudomonas fluorescens TaxID=294 RepID=A0A0P8X724_PSEFL|nr:hypothetical protein AN403_6019 [Pseudomonas fluorescens]
MRKPPTHLCLLDQMPQRQCCQPLPARALSDPIAHLSRTRRQVDAFQIGSTNDCLTAIHDDKRMPGADGKIG